MLKNEPMKLIVGAILAGLMISMGGTVYLSCSNKYIGAALFSLGLLTIIRFGMFLFTGRVGYLPATKLSNLPSFIADLIAILLFNAVGTLLGATLFMCSKLGSLFSEPTHLQAVAQQMVNAKCADSPLSLICLGIGCGMCMGIAVISQPGDIWIDGNGRCQLVKRFSNPLMVIMPVMVFILCGFEHCVADMFYCYITACDIFSFIKIVGLSAIGNTIGGAIIGYWAYHFYCPKAR